MNSGLEKLSGLLQGAQGCPAFAYIVLFATFVVLILLCCWFAKTESRVWVRRFYSSAMGYVAIVVSLSMLLLFVIQYIPKPIMGEGSSASIAARRALPRDPARDFYHDCFSDLLTVLSVLGTVFGLIVPIGAYFIQKRSLRDETQLIQQEVKFRESQLAQKHRELQRSIRSMKLDLDGCTSELAPINEMRKMIFGICAESMRSSMDGILMTYCLPGSTDEYKERVIESYLTQFFYFLRLAALCPSCGPFDSDLKRFSDAMARFRMSADVYKKAVQHYSSAMSRESMPFAAGLSMAFDSGQINVLRKELEPILPAIFAT